MHLPLKTGYNQYYVIVGYYQVLVVKADTFQLLIMSRVPWENLDYPIQVNPANRNLLVGIEEGCSVTLLEIIEMPSTPGSSTNSCESVTETTRQYRKLQLQTRPNATIFINNYLIVGTLYGNIFMIPLERVWEMEEKQDAYLMMIPDQHQGAVTSLVTSDDEKLLISDSTDGTLHVIDVENRVLLHVLDGHTDKVNISTKSFSKYNSLKAMLYLG